ncbi:hypothetical protein OHA77_41165 [Streptosporangium sp. NBC_01639]|uniref:hypothetical protein n=1 Tax=Streptosporangium sp. NBC_01639 TaxID=2975948 RepID=UPI00386C4302|nr:hypothetical protein OHA77_41165 [Streptosporangium sp. NBC_01639]
MTPDQLASGGLTPDVVPDMVPSFPAPRRPWGACSPAPAGGGEEEGGARPRGRRPYLTVRDSRDSLTARRRVPPARVPDEKRCHRDFPGQIR